MRTPEQTVEDWHAAVNARDVDAAVALCAPDVAVGGPRGTGHGRDLVRAWLVRSGIELVPQHEVRVVDGRALVHEKARWTTTDDAPVQLRDGDPRDTWVVLDVADGLLTSIARFETEADALAAVSAGGPVPPAPPAPG